jgi:uncharacterized cofD-like protein
MPKKRVVVIGGGSGNYQTLTGLKEQNLDITAIVATTDDGGSSGRLREELGLLPLGDVRQCLIALANDNDELAQLKTLFSYRFSGKGGLGGHSFGNLALAALTDITGDVPNAIATASKLLKIQGRVFPVTLTNSILKARLQNGVELIGESEIGHRYHNLDIPIEAIYMEPAAFAFPPSVKAILEADTIVIGPGDIYTSILPNLLVDGIAKAIRNSKAKKIYICNLMTKLGESTGFQASDFLRLVCKYLGHFESLDYLLINNDNNRQQHKKFSFSGQQAVALDIMKCKSLVNRIVSTSLVSENNCDRHDPSKLSEALLTIINEP